MDPVRNLRIAPRFAGIEIAATVRAHGLSILSWSLKHFHPIEASIVNLFGELRPRPDLKRSL